MTEDRCRQYQGRYRGVVVSDPDEEGRLKVVVPDVLGDKEIWATSASPLAGRDMGIYVAPPQRAAVWIEFEQGDPDTAIWTGCWRGSKADVPAAASADPANQPPIVIQSQSKNKIIVSSVPGKGIRLETGKDKGPFIEITDSRITISDGGSATITLENGEVAINNDGLKVK